MKERLLILLSLPIACLVNACGNNNNKIVVQTKIKSVTDRAFGNVDLDLNQQQLESKGINYDDLLKFTIHNPDEGGEDTVFEAAFVKNYNEVGYFAPNLCNYTGTQERPEISFGIMKEKNNPDALVGRDVTIEVVEKGGYADTRKLVDVATKLSYEELGEDNLAYANFRDVTSVGTISNCIPARRLYRGSSPFNFKSNPNGRDVIADAYLEVYEIESEISLADTDTKIAEYMSEIGKRHENSHTTLDYYNKSKDETDLGKKSFFAVCLGSDYFDTSRKGVDGDATKTAFQYIAKRFDEVHSKSLPIYFHCNEGKDRTGFFAMVLEALCGVPLNDIISDAMLTFKNYYNVSRANDRQKYNCLAELLIYRQVYSILVDDPVNELGKINWYEFNAKMAVEKKIGSKEAALKEAALHYLGTVLGLTANEIKSIESWLSFAN